MHNIKSMTGYASARVNLSAGSLALDLKSVNSRFLELNLKLPDNFKYLEGALRDKLKAMFQRGKFDLTFSFTPTAAQGLKLNQPLLQALCQRLEDIKTIFPDGRADLMQILLYPGIISEDFHERAQLDAQILSCFDQLLADLDAHRISEGTRLAAAIEEKLQLIEKELAPVREQLAQLVTQERDKLRQRLYDLKLEIEPERFEQEAALLAQKADIAEEYDRLNSHISEVRRILRQGGNCGKRLDFMMQEFNREANTMAAKASNLALTQTAVELKVLIEQMREQVQNLE